jgi:Tol biopolymer transport system component
MQVPAAWTPDGRSLVYVQGGDIHVWSADADPPGRPLARTPFGERHADLSPDGRWLAYSSNETGRWEVYVAAFPGMDRKWPISTGGGVEPAWSRDGRTLSFLEPSEARGVRVIQLDVRLGDAFSPGVQRVLFDFPGYSGGIVSRVYDVSADGGRFLFVRETHPPVRVELDRVQIVLGWFDDLRAKLEQP